VDHEVEGERKAKGECLMGISQDILEEIEVASALLREMLANGPVAIDKINVKAVEKGITKKALLRAKANLKVMTIKSRGVVGWCWGTEDWVLSYTANEMYPEAVEARYWPMVRRIERKHMARSYNPNSMYYGR
jgi:hypothetical protein